MAGFLDTLFGGGDSGAHAQTVMAQQQRQKTQNATDYINALFGGGFGTLYNPVASGVAYDPNATYYSLTGGGKNWTDVTKQVNAKNIGGWEKGRGIFTPEAYSLKGYSDDFYNQRGRDYIDYYMPQLAGQLDSSKRATLYNLTNAGVADSSIAKSAARTFNRQANKQQQSVIDGGTQASNQLRQQMESLRASLINQAAGAIDPANAAKGALSTASLFTAPNMWAPLMNFTSPSYQARIWAPQIGGAMGSMGGMGGQQGGGQPLNNASSYNQINYQLGNY